MPAAAKSVAAVTALMALFWMTEALPIAVTALLPVVLFPLLGVTDIESVTANYAHHLVFLFLGGFWIAAAMERSNAHRRIALLVLRVVGSRMDMVILGFMAATAFLSMWLSNTATTMMMLPIALAALLLSWPALLAADERILEYRSELRLQRDGSLADEDAGVAANRRR